MTDHHIQLWMLIVQLFAFIGLGIYVLETRRLRKASQDQIRISQDLIKAAMDQVEGLSKPCLTLWSELRDQKDAILELSGARSSVRARDDQGDLVTLNIGNGFAMNVNYRFTATPPTVDARSHHVRYIPNIMATAKITMVEPMSAYVGLWTLTMHYDSIGGRRYETVINLNNLVLTNFKFRQIDRHQQL